MTGIGLIDPIDFDLIVLGTGLQESLLAAAAAANRLNVLHLDPHEFYGAHWTSLELNQFAAWAATGGSFTPSSPRRTDQDSNSTAPCIISGVDQLSSDSPDLTRASLESGSDEYMTGARADNLVKDSHPLVVRPTENDNPERRDPETEAVLHPVVSSKEELLDAIELEVGGSYFSEVKVCEFEGVSLGDSRSYNIDLSGPKVTFCGSNLVQLLLRSGAHHYVEFKGIDASYIWTGTGIAAVPSSRADVFKDTSLSLSDKRHLMRFFKLVTDYASSGDQSIVDTRVEDLEGPFLNFLEHQRLPHSVQSVVLYAIALVDEEQRLDVEDQHGDYLRTRQGLEKLALYLSSVARFPNAPGAFLYPLYGQGELPQAFCRSAAVNGTLYVLRQTVDALLVDKDSKVYKGIRTSQGQVLYSRNLILGPSVVPKSGNCGDLLKPRTCPEPLPLGKQSGSKVARCVCITDSSISDPSTLLVIFPPQSIKASIKSVVRALQLSSVASVCPVGKYIIHFSTNCTDPVDGLEVLKAAVDALFLRPETLNAENIAEKSGVDVLKKPKLLWSVFYAQALHTAAESLKTPGVTICTMPDGSLDGEAFLASTEKLFRAIFPDKDYFPQVSVSQTPDDEQNAN